MSNSGNGGEPSMEEILASIRALVSQDTAQPAAQPVAPPQSAQQQHAAPTPGLVQGGQERPSPAGDSRTEPPHSTPPGAPASTARLDEDDLADLLDEPLPPAEQPVSAPGVTPPLSADWNTGASAAGADRAGDAGSSAPTPMPFDFGAMVPSRDPAPARDTSGGSSLPPLSHTPAAARSMESPGATLSNGNLSAGWPQPTRGGQDVARPGSGSASPERPISSPGTEAERPSAPAAKSPANGAEQPAGKSLDKPATEAAEPGSVSLAAPQNGPNKFFSAPVTSPPASSLSRPLVSRSEESATTALAQPGSEKPSVETASPASGSEMRPSSTPSFFTRMAGATQAPAKESAPSTYPSIEPVLKAFGKNDAKADRPAPALAPASSPGSMNASGTASQGNSSSSKAPPSATSKTSNSNAEAGQDRLGERTLEDAVMHLLRPMLREWLDENLPRIVEDAVRREIAEAVKNKIGQVPKL